MRINLQLLILGSFLIIFIPAGQEINQNSLKSDSTDQKTDTEELLIENCTAKPLITFIELGSVKCIPCKKMQPVMEAIEKKYADQVDVVFYDVWKKDQKKYSKLYNVISIPTQVFLDSTGNEIHRHMGFYPEKEIDKFLQSQGVNPVSSHD